VRVILSQFRPLGEMVNRGSRVRVPVRLHIFLTLWNKEVTKINLLWIFGKCPRDPGRDSNSGLWLRPNSFKFDRLLIACGTIVMVLYSRWSSTRLFKLKTTGGIPPVTSSSKNRTNLSFLIHTHKINKNKDVSSLFFAMLNNIF
jgi:hypothetical protein